MFLCSHYRSEGAYSIALQVSQRVRPANIKIWEAIVVKSVISAVLSDARKQKLERYETWVNPHTGHVPRGGSSEP